MSEVTLRNRKILHLVDMAIKEFCRLLGYTYEKSEETYLVMEDNKNLFW